MTLEAAGIFLQTGYQDKVPPVSDLALPGTKDNPFFSQTTLSHQYPES